ncbi:unnamed protein product [Orchesella dallaii]|uniref:Uncharacterized protein n=1 Tax=Orchesella dallaii TaxID=48710 RepID=A0ABP1QDR7_9HEXA
METRSQAAARRAREAESGVSGVDMDINQLQTDHQGHRDSTSTSTSATTVIMSTPEETQLFSARLNQTPKEASIKSVSSKAPSSKKVERMKERLKLEEEAVKMRLQLNEIRIRQLNLEDDEDSAADLSEEEIPSCTRTEEWVDAQSHASPPPTFTNYDTIFNQTEFGFGHQEQGFRFGNGDSAIKKETVPPPPPLRGKPESVPVSAAPFVPERQQFYNFPQAPPPDPIAALTTALQAIMDTEKKMEKKVRAKPAKKTNPMFATEERDGQRLKVKSCSCCDKQDHEIMMCPKFEKMNAVERSEFATSKRLFPMPQSWAWVTSLLEQKRVWG